MTRDLCFGAVWIVGTHTLAFLLAVTAHGLLN